MARLQFGLGRAFWALFVLSVFFAAWSYLPIERSWPHFWAAYGVTMTAVAILAAIVLLSRWLQRRNRL
jgi:hypothetical protein